MYKIFLQEGKKEEAIQRVKDMFSKDSDAIEKIFDAASSLGTKFIPFIENETKRYLIDQEFGLDDFISILTRRIDYFKKNSDRITPEVIGTAKQLWDGIESKAFPKLDSVMKSPKDIIKDPYVLEFLDLKENKRYLEKDIESALISNLQDFLLELGKGFSFISRQNRITIDGDHYYIDLVFYNYLLKCFVLIDLKIGKLTHQDIGQMDFYIHYYEKEIKKDNDNPTLGILETI